jgi:hypothetical protein
MFEAWETFYIIIAPSAAALIGLLFVVSTLTVSLDRAKVASSNSLHMTAVVFHFAGKQAEVMLDAGSFAEGRLVISRRSAPRSPPCWSRATSTP